MPARTTEKTEFRPAVREGYSQKMQPLTFHRRQLALDRRFFATVSVITFNKRIIPPSFPFVKEYFN